MIRVGEHSKQHPSTKPAYQRVVGLVQGCIVTVWLMKISSAWQKPRTLLGCPPRRCGDGTATALFPPVRRPGSDYRYYRRADLEPFRLQYRRAQEAAAAGGDSSIFATANADIEANTSLRDPQREAHRAVREHFSGHPGPAIVQIPVGCGKTGIMATLPFGIARGRTFGDHPEPDYPKGRRRRHGHHQPAVLLDQMSGPLRLHRRALDGGSRRA